MVSVWMDHGNIMGFTAAHPDANRIELLMDVTNGLTHMHNLNITHGDLKGVRNSRILALDKHRTSLSRQISS